MAEWSSFSWPWALSDCMISMASELNGALTLNWCEVSMTFCRSLMCSSMRKPGSKLPSKIFCDFWSMTVEPARPLRMAS